MIYKPQLRSSRNILSFLFPRILRTRNLSKLRMNHKDVSNEIWKFENFENYFFKFGSRCILIKLYTQEFESHLPRFKLCFSYCVGFGLGFLFESQRDYWLSISLRLDSTELNQIMFSLHMSESPSEHPSLPLQAILNLNLDFAFIWLYIWIR